MITMASSRTTSLTTRLMSNLTQMAILDDSQLVNLSEKKKDHQKAFIEGGYSLNNLPKLSSKRPRATASESFQSMFKIQKTRKGEGEGEACSPTGTDTGW